MTLVTPHFHVEEFDCKDGTPYPTEWVEVRLKPLCETLEVVREKCGNHPITIVSGYRTLEWNKLVGGVEESRHLVGDAADFLIGRVPAKNVYEIAFALQETGLVHCGGLALYKARVPFVHLDIRGKRARWEGAAGQVPL